MSTDSSVITRSFQEPSAFGELFQRHAARLYRYVSRRAGPSAADDVISETFLVAFERRVSYDLSRDDALPWLFGIATNLIHRHRVAEARTLRMLEESAGDTARDAEHDSGRADPAQILAARDDFSDTARQIRRLSKKDRDTLLLYAWEDLSYEDIALALEIPVGTVRSRLNRARRALRTAPATEEGQHERVQHTSVTA